MKAFVLEREQLVETELEKAWEFFSLPDNLSVITPAYLNFKILSPKDRSKIFSGMRISYTVNPVLGIPMKWVTKIEDVDAPNKFVDTQEKGPYKLWRHTHIFTQTEKGVLIKDRVEYILPLGILGKLAHSIFVRKQLEGIFEYRTKVIKDIFKE